MNLHAGSLCAVVAALSMTTLASGDDNSTVQPTVDYVQYGPIQSGTQSTSQQTASSTDACNYYTTYAGASWPVGGIGLYTRLLAGQTYTALTYNGVNSFIGYESSGPQSTSTSNYVTWQTSGSLRKDTRAIEAGREVQFYFKADFAGTAADTWAAVSGGNWTAPAGYCLELKLYLYRGTSGPEQRTGTYAFDTIADLHSVITSGQSNGVSISIQPGDDVTRYSAIATIHGGVNPMGSDLGNCTDSQYVNRFGFFVQHNDSSALDSTSVGTCCMQDGSCLLTTTVEDCSSSGGSWINETLCSACPDVPGDMNGDGLVNALDLDELHDATGICTGDADHNGTVDILDLLKVIDTWGGCP